MSLIFYKIIKSHYLAQIKYELELNTKFKTGKAVAWEINNYMYYEELF